MKRFFQPVKEDGSFKKPSLSSADPLLSTVGDLVSVEGIHTVEAGERERREPCKFLTWNANSLLLRMKKDLPEFSNLVQTLDPDVIAIQEVRMPAAGPKGGQKNPSELKDDTCSSREEKQESAAFICFTTYLDGKRIIQLQIWRTKGGLSMGVRSILS
ncbi:hypothetical protein MA16_Dca007745 [Dendrobium catenatum]|uniref:Uncharacterized protein n=1 Tax=Dendrobium catenatum TaxID=906689 RepID=A0A2I0X576_9ASPA|nr:hypothetical protein MA16_Dca007745 [Dendrobium catenatum]